MKISIVSSFAGSCDAIHERLSSPRFKHWGCFKAGSVSAPCGYRLHLVDVYERGFSDEELVKGLGAYRLRLASLAETLAFDCGYESSRYPEHTIVGGVAEVIDGKRQFAYLTWADYSAAGEMFGERSGSFDTWDAIWDRSNILALVVDNF